MLGFIIIAVIACVLLLRYGYWNFSYCILVWGKIILVGREIGKDDFFSCGFIVILSKIGVLLVSRKGRVDVRFVVSSVCRIFLRLIDYVF